MRFILLLFSVQLFFSCKNTPPESRADHIAVQICDCSGQLLELNKKAAAITQAAAADTIDFKAIQIEFEKTRTCIAEQHMKPEDLFEVKRSLAIKCPELTKQTELLEELLAK